MSDIFLDNEDDLKSSMSQIASSSMSQIASSSMSQIASSSMSQIASSSMSQIASSSMSQIESGDGNEDDAFPADTVSLFGRYNISSNEDLDAIINQLSNVIISLTGEVELLLP
jgi:hypothetical protein